MSSILNSDLVTVVCRKFVYFILLHDQRIIGRTVFHQHRRSLTKFKITVGRHLTLHPILQLLLEFVDVFSAITEFFILLLILTPHKLPAFKPVPLLAHRAEQLILGGLDLSRHLPFQLVTDAGHGLLDVRDLEK